MTETTLIETIAERKAEKINQNTLVQKQVQNILEVFDAHVLCGINSTLQTPQAYTETCHH